MTRVFPTRAVVALALAMTAACSRSRPVAAPPPSAEAYDSALGVASFDTAWGRIHSTYYDTTFHGIDWRALRASLLPRVQRARSTDEVRAAIKTLFDTLGESHFALVPGTVARAMRADTTTSSGIPGTIGVTMRLVDGHVLVTAVEAGSPAEHAGVRPGWEVVSVGAHRAAPMLAAQHSLGAPVAARRAGLQLILRLMASAEAEAGSAVELELRDGSGRPRQLTVTAVAAPGEIVKYLQLPPQRFALEHRRYADPAGCVGFVRFNSWMLPVLPALERAMEGLADCRGIVLDLRGNLGGVAGLLMGVSGFFVDTAVSLGTLTARHTTLRYVVNPQRSNRRGEVVRPYAGRLAILVDPLSASASELFAEGMRVIGRARIFGDTTAGEALPAALARLPNGDLIMYVIADFHAPDGRRVEATGVVPDVLVPPSRRSLAQGGDAPLSAALAWAGGTATVGTRAPIPP